MPALKPTHFTATLTWLGRVTKHESSIRSEPLTHAHLSFAGIEGERHGGLTRPACSRTTAQYPKGTEIRNVRQLSVLSQEELDAIATQMGGQALDPVWLGASMVLKGIPDFSHIPPSARLQFESGASIAVDMENRPCIFPAQEIEKDRPGHGAQFKSAAQGKRGVTAWVEREGDVALGDTVRLHIPDQPIWSCLDAVQD